MGIILRNCLKHGNLIKIENENEIRIYFKEFTNSFLFQYLIRELKDSYNFEKTESYIKATRKEELKDE